MVMSWKKFVEKVQSEWAGWIFWQQWISELQQTVQEQKQRAEQHRPVDVSDTTIDQLWNTSQSSFWDTEQIAKDAKAISDAWDKVKSRVNQKQAEAKVEAQQRAQEKEELLNQDIYEDTAKIEKVAWLDEQWKQNIASKARQEYEAYQALWEQKWLWWQKIKDMFPQYWDTTDWKREYRTDWQYVIDRPVGYTTDLVDTLQDAYNSVTYALAQDWVLLTPDDLKNAYPEYKNVSDWVLANFISWCQYDVQMWRKSDIKTIADAMWTMALTEWYTNRMDWWIDTLSDESIINWWRESSFSKNKDYIDMKNAADILKDYVTQIRETWAFAEWLSDWQILSNYRNLKSDDEGVQEAVKEIDRCMTLLEEQESHDWIEAFVARLYENYKWNVKWARTDLSDEDFEVWDTNRIMVQKETAKYREKFQNFLYELRAQSEEEGRYPMKNFLEYTILWQYYMDNKWNYYRSWPLSWSGLYNKQKLVYSRMEDWTYMDTEWNRYTEEQVKALTWWTGMAAWMLNALTSIADKWAEAYVDFSRIWAAYELWWLSATTQYDFALAWDLLSAWLGAVMTNPMIQLWFNAPWYWLVQTAIFDIAMDAIWTVSMALMQELWITEWWTVESKEKTQELLAIFWTMFAQRTLKTWTKKIKESPKYKALEKAMRSFVWKLMKSMNIKDKKVLERMIEFMNAEIEKKYEEKQKKLLENQQKQQTTLEEDVRVKERVDTKLEKEKEIEKETAKAKAWEAELKAELPLFSLLRTEFHKAKSEFFDEFYEEYKKQAGWEENMDQAVLLEKDLRDMEDPEKRQQLIDKYKEIFGEEILEKNAKEWENFWKEIMELKQEVMDSMKEQPELEQKDTKDILEEEALPGKKPTKKYEKIEQKRLDLPWNTKTSLRENPFRYILKEILEDIMEPIKNKKWEIIKYKRKRNISRVEVQERIMERWKEMAQEYMNKLKENQKKIFDFKKDFFDTDIDYDIKDFFTDFLKKTGVNNKLSELFKKWILSLEEVYDENWKMSLEVVYNWEQRIPPTEAREAMDLLNDIIKELDKYWQDDKLLLDEASLYELRKLMKDWGYNVKWKEKAGTFADRAQDLYTIFNDYLDTYKDKTWIWKDIRPYDHAFSDYFELVDLLDKFFNWEGEIKKESRNRLINIAEKAWEKLNLLDKLIPGTKEMLKLMESWHDFITKMISFMEKTDYKTWFWRRFLKYGAMTMTMELFRRLLHWWLLAKILWVTWWEEVWEEVKSIFGRQRPFTKEINEIFKQLDLTEEEIQILKEKRPKEFEKTLSDLDAHFDEALKEILWDYEKGRQTEEWPRAYDRQGNEVKRVNEDWTPIEWESWEGPKWPDSWGPDVPPTPKWPKSWGGESKETTKTIEEVQKEINNAEDDAIMDELDLIENTSNKLEKIVENMIKTAETPKDAKMIIAAAWLKMTNRLLALRDSPRVKAAKEKANRMMKMDKGYELLQKMIDKTEGEEQLVYVNALYKMMLAWKAPTSMITIDYDYVADKKNIKDSADYSTEGQNKANWEMNKEIPTWFWYGEWYDSMIAEIVKKMIKAGKREVQDSWVTDSVYQFLKWWDQDAAWKQVIDDAYTAYDRVMEKDKTTTREQARNIKIKEAEGKRIKEEVWELMDPEDIKKREDLWFSFDKEVKSKNKTRRDNQWATIVNKDKVDYIDWWLTRWTIMISWGPKDWTTRVMVNNLETLSNFPQVEKSLPKNSIIIDSSTWKEYSLADIQRMDIKWETNTKIFEEYYEEQMKSYPEEVQDIFNEKEQVKPSTEWKSEPQETQAEQSTTENKKVDVLNKKAYSEIEKYQWNLKEIYEKAWDDDYVYFVHNTASENLASIEKDWIRSYKSRGVNKQWEDSPSANRWTLDDNRFHWHGGNWVYFRIKKSEAKKLMVNDSEIMVYHDIPASDIVAINEAIGTKEFGDRYGNWNKWEVIKWLKESIDEFWLDKVKEVLLGKWFDSERKKYFEELWIDVSESVESFFSGWERKEIKDYTYEELLDAATWMKESKKQEVINEMLKRAREWKFTLGELKEIEANAIWYRYWKAVEKELKDLIKKKEKAELEHLFWEDKKTAEETNADSLVEAIKKYNWVDVAEFISHKWDKKGKTHIHLKDMTASDSRSFQEFVMNHKDLIEIYDDWWMGYVIKFKPWFKDNIKKYLK